MAQLNLGRVIGKDGADGAVGATGSQGLQGKGYSTKGEWVSGSYYVNSNTTVDVVYYKGSAYYCKTTNSRTIAPSEDTEYWGLLAKGMLGGATQLYDTAVDAGGDECPEELPDVMFGLPAKMYEEQREPEVGDLMLYHFLVPNKYGQSIILCKITKIYNGNALEKGVDAQPISFVQGKDASNCLPITSAFLGIDANSSVVVENGVIFNYTDGEVEYGDGERNDTNIWMQIKLPFVAGQGVKFETDESGKLIKVIAKGGGISVANTEEELKSMLTEENIGSIVAYNGKLYFIADDIKVGDTLTELYFDKSWLPYIYSTFGADVLIKTGETKTVLIQNGESVEFTTQLGLIATNEDDPQQYKLVWRTCEYENIVLEQLTEDTIRVVVDGQLYYEGNIDGGGNLDDIIVDTVVYRDYEEFWANSGKPTGWLVDKLTIESPVTVTELNSQEVWGKHISKYSVFSVDFESEDGNYFASKIVGSNDSGIDSITVEGTSFIITYADGKVETVEIDYENTAVASPTDFSYNDLADQPIIIGDLDAITPVANTYYKHNGADETTYTKGVIYFYDGEVFKSIVGGGSSRTITSINVSLQADGVDDDGIQCQTDSDCEIEYDGGNEYAYPPAFLRIPITAGAGIEFVEEDNNTVSINATGGGGATLNKYSYTQYNYLDSTANIRLKNILQNAKGNIYFNNYNVSYTSTSYWTIIRKFNFITDADGVKVQIVMNMFSSSSGTWNKGSVDTYNMTTNTLTSDTLTNNDPQARTTIIVEYWNDTEIT